MINARHAWNMFGKTLTEKPCISLGKAYSLLYIFAAHSHEDKYFLAFFGFSGILPIQDQSNSDRYTGRKGEATVFPQAQITEPRVVYQVNFKSNSLAMKVTFPIPAHIEIG